jgi:hypothetical protein
MKNEEWKRKSGESSNRVSRGEPLCFGIPHLPFSFPFHFAFCIFHYSFHFRECPST